MLAKSQPNLLDIESDNDSDIYDSSNSLRSTSTNTLNEDEMEKEHKEKERKVSNIIYVSKNAITIYHYHGKDKFALKRFSL